jgi:hypothetical protein
MKRRLLTILAVVSLVACLIVCVFWVRSYFVIDRATFASDRLGRAVSGGGGVFLESLQLVSQKGSWRDKTMPVTRTVENYADWRDKSHAARTGTAAPRVWESRTYDRAALMKDAWGPEVNLAIPQLTRIEVLRERTFMNTDGSLIADSLVGPRLWVPYWVLFAVTAFLPGYRLFSYARRSRRSRRNLCPGCGYDLRATPERCPECGANPATAGASKRG